MASNDWTSKWNIHIDKPVILTPEHDAELMAFIDAMYGPRRADIFIPPVGVDQRYKRPKFDWSKIGATTTTPPR
jgi:hypothetical protein